MCKACGNSLILGKTAYVFIEDDKACPKILREQMHPDQPESLVWVCKFCLKKTRVLARNQTLAVTDP
ncbi:hypothetical protein DSO57_1009899 [Entomophthora muscae]|uniref:Uncharacterized protein n=1 Tax=Entomophthora muscae TaxID=34485 RepID=A0ACC2U4G2_9FUNG|nr:hypothetical protein DSO57_1009899 [Entomophthora muscae]